MTDYQTDEEILKIRAGVNHDYEVHRNPNSARAIREAEDNDLDVVYPTAYQLQLDIDTERAMQIFYELKPVLDKYYGIVGCVIEDSRSGFPKRHVTLTLRGTVTNMERIALQACLGSDRVRELLGVIQERAGDPHPTLFLEKR